MKKRFFKAQALAIVMVVLVIASIIGVALFSRISKSRQAAIDQQNSNAGIEAADSMLDVLVGANLEAIENEVLPQEATDSDIPALLNKLGIDPALIPDLSTWCPGNEPDSRSSLTLRVEEAEEGDFPEIGPGSVRAYNFQDVTVSPGGCNLGIHVTGTDGISVFIVKQVFEDDDPVVDNYCVNSDGGDIDCSNQTIDDIDPESSLQSPSWEGDPSNYYSLFFNLTDLVGTGLAEIRVLPIVGSIGINNTDISGCTEGKSYKTIKITAEANCNGSFRAKQMFLPGSGNLGYSTLFDYGIYDNGLFQP
jgi:type II secretory pathway pseudopilin PulG